MNTYSIDSDSPRWWWPPAAAGAVGAAAITAILALATTGSALPDGPPPNEAPALTNDPWFANVDPGMGRQCYAARWNATLDHEQPLCGHSPTTQYPGKSGVRRPDLDSRP